MSIPLSGSGAIKRVLIVLAFCLLSLFLFGSVVSVGVLYPFSSSLEIWKGSTLLPLKGPAEIATLIQASNFEDWRKIEDVAKSDSFANKYARRQMCALGTFKQWKELCEGLPENSGLKELAAQQTVKLGTDEQLAVAFFDTKIFDKITDSKSGLECYSHKKPNMIARLILDKLAKGQSREALRERGTKSPKDGTLKQFYLWLWAINAETFEQAKICWSSLDGIAKQGALFRMAQITPSFGEWKREFDNAPKDSEFKLGAWKQMIISVDERSSEWKAMWEKAISLSVEYQKAVFSRIKQKDYSTFAEWDEIGWWLSKCDFNKFSVSDLFIVCDGMYQHYSSAEECKRTYALTIALEMKRQPGANSVYFQAKGDYNRHLNAGDYGSEQ